MQFIFTYSKHTYRSPLNRLNRTLNAFDDDEDPAVAADADGGVMATANMEQVQDICAYSRHQGLGHKISGKSLCRAQRPKPKAKSHIS